ncbi:Hypothetical predicted protein [Paramuricea clavata]|uniref:Uncharacterized protein n=1 Tax=Paramuricea clavata TaxID=317549 RepID=A0A6S7H9A9_PARCT|nr:Hypothetical predicted protein [Paramuricea clavata]
MVAGSDSATSESDVENSYNTDSEVETDSVFESNSDNVDDTSNEVGDEYESDPWAPLKAKATQQSLSEFEELTQKFTAEERQPYLIRAKPTALDLENVLKELYRLSGNSKKQSMWNKSGIKNIPMEIYYLFIKLAASFNLMVTAASLHPYQDPNIYCK